MPDPWLRNCQISHPLGPQSTGRFRLRQKESRVNQGKNAGRKASHVTRTSAGGTGVDRTTDLRHGQRQARCAIWLRSLRALRRESAMHRTFRRFLALSILVMTAFTQVPNQTWHDHSNAQNGFVRCAAAHAHVCRKPCNDADPQQPRDWQRLYELYELDELGVPHGKRPPCHASDTV